MYLTIFPRSMFRLKLIYIINSKVQRYIHWRGYIDYKVQLFPHPDMDRSLPDRFTEATAYLQSLS